MLNMAIQVKKPTGRDIVKIKINIYKGLSTESEQLKVIFSPVSSANLLLITTLNLFLKTNFHQCRRVLW